jgi:hypothetical protein
LVRGTYGASTWVTARTEQVAAAKAVALLESARPADAWARVVPSSARLVAHGIELAGDARSWLAEMEARTAPLSVVVEWRSVDGERAAAWVHTALPDPDREGFRYDAPLIVIVDGGASVGRVELFAPCGTWDEVAADWIAARNDAGEHDELEPPLIGRSHPALPDPAPDRAVLEAVADALVSENWLDLVAWGARWHDHGAAPIERFADGPRRELARVLDGARIVLVIEHEFPAIVVAHVDDTGRVTYLDHLADTTSAST